MRRRGPALGWLLVHRHRREGRLPLLSVRLGIKYLALAQGPVPESEQVPGLRSETEYLLKMDFALGPN